MRLWIRGRQAATFLAVVVLLLAGCATPPPTPSGDRLAAQVDQARAARQAGQLQRSAELFESAAELADSPQRQKLRLQAALVYLDLGVQSRAQDIADSIDIDATALDPEGSELHRLVRARLARLQGDSAQALELLTPTASALSDGALTEWLTLEAKLALNNDQPLRAARALDRQSSLLPPAQQSTNRRQIWDALLQVPMEKLRELVPPTPDRFGGWLELAYVVRVNRLKPDQLQQELEGWEDRYPDHPAAGPFAMRVAKRQQEAVGTPSDVTLMLPLSGPLAQAGEAVRRGFLAAYYDMPPEQRPTLRVYDLGDQGTDAVSAYRDAVESGTDLVIGPLTKSSLESMTVWKEFPVKVLALNRLNREDYGADDLYQFGLAPEEDAQAAAKLAVDRGYRRLVALAPANDWGDRTLAAFRQAMDEMDGTVLETAQFDPETSDFSDAIRRVFNLDVSVRRYRQLRSVVRRNLEFQPRRRQDVQAVFVAAFPRQARLMRPQIRFHRGIGIPVIATSDAYSGHPDREADQDMDGLTIVDIPWLYSEELSGELARIHDQIAGIWPPDDDPFPRLYALGVDAFRLAGRLKVLRSEPSLSVAGASGRLSIDAQGVIHRELIPVSFENGLAAPAAENRVADAPGDGAHE
ncbi:MAG: penicillin-binding protein activator [Ectothiorhodospiraceae bacterium]|jgi:hypothetical protein